MGKNINQWQQLFAEQLKCLYSDNEAFALTTRTIEHITNFSKAEQILNKTVIPPVWQQAELYRFLQGLKENIPFQYLTEKCEFFNIEVTVNPAVLIPRPETEELVNWIIETHKTQSNLTILDIGTGSGCIAISLAKNLIDAKVTATDISNSALDTAKKNAHINNVNISFKLANIINYQIDSNEKFDIIVSNPPYITEAEKQFMHNNVLQNEPHTALFVSNRNPLLFYEAISNFAKEQLNSTGYIYFEINENFGKEVCQLLESNGFTNIILKKDLNNKDRMIKAQV